MAERMQKHGVVRRRRAVARLPRPFLYGEFRKGKAANDLAKARLPEGEEPPHFATVSDGGIMGAEHDVVLSFKLCLSGGGVTMELQSELKMLCDLLEQRQRLSGNNALQTMEVEGWLANVLGDGGDGGEETAQESRAIFEAVIPRMETVLRKVHKTIVFLAIDWHTIRAHGKLRHNHFTVLIV